MHADGRTHGVLPGGIRRLALPFIGITLQIARGS